MSPLQQLAHWLNAEGITGNVIAWAVCGIPGFLLSHLAHRRFFRREIQRLGQPRQEPVPAPANQDPDQKP